MSATRLILNGFSVVPSPDPSSADSAVPVPVPGSSFKPLRLSNHPWVRSHLRRASRDPQKPRLSFLAQHQHMHGPESFSHPEEATRVVSGGGIRRISPEGLEEVFGRSDQPTPIPESTAGFLNTPVQVTHASKSYSATDVSIPFPEESRFGNIDIQLDACTVSEHRPGRARSVSAPGRIASPSPHYEASGHDSALPCRSSHKTKKIGREHPAVTPLGIAAFSDAFVSVLTTSDNIFGYSGSMNYETSKIKHNRPGALELERAERTHGNGYDE